MKNRRSAVIAGFFMNQKQTLTLTLSQRERGLIEWTGRGTPTWDTESNTDFERPTIGPLSLGRGLG
jgi:hypothetical protein